MWDDGHTLLRELSQLLANQSRASFVPRLRLQSKYTSGRRIRRHDLRSETVQLGVIARLQPEPLGVGPLLGAEGSQLDAIAFPKLSRRCRGCRSRARG